MTLYPRHIKVLEAVNGYSTDNYIDQKSGVRTSGKVIAELITKGLIVRKRNQMTGNVCHLTDRGKKAISRNG